jgi:peptidoglycan hydrolase-like protein with peptidoglycan-binding domain
MNILNLIKSLFVKKIFTGVVFDNRSEKEKENDYYLEEIAFTPTLKLVSKKKALEQKKKWFVFNQRSTSACVAHAKALLKLIKSGFKANPLFTYRLRSNFNGQGMIGDNVGNIGKNVGYVSYETLEEPTTEAKANSLVITPEMLEEAEKNRDENYFSVADRSFNNLASLANSGEPVMIYIYATEKEWSKDRVEILDKPILGMAQIQHAVAILPNSVFKDDDKRYCIVQESAFFGGHKHREVSEEFINARCYYAQVQKEKEPIDIKKPKYKFSKDLKLGMMNDPDVVGLQKCLMYEKTFEYPEATGNFLGYTKKAVIKFQEKYVDEILKPWGLTQGTGYVGKTTIAKLNKLFNN